MAEADLNYFSTCTVPCLINSTNYLIKPKYKVVVKGEFVIAD